MSSNLLLLNTDCAGHCPKILQVYQLIILTITLWEALFWLFIAVYLTSLSGWKQQFIVISHDSVDQEFGWLTSAP